MRKRRNILASLVRDEATDKNYTEEQLEKTMLMQGISWPFESTVGHIAGPRVEDQR